MYGCINTQQVNKEIQHFQIPENWQHTQQLSVIENNWLAQFQQPFLETFINQALNSNQALLQAAYSVDIAKQQVIQSGASLWPDLDLSLNTSRSKTAATQVVSNQHSLKLESSYEIDIWGKLSDNQKNAHLNYLATKAQHQQQKQEIVGQVISNGFNLIMANQLTHLFQQRVKNAQQSLDIIESGYQQGVNTALDVYLSRNELNTETANLASQQTNLLQSARVLEQLLGRYPSGQIVTEINQQSLPLLTNDIPLGLPSEIVSRKPELQSAWYQVLAQDAALAFAHKQRFPSIKLTASVSNTSDELSDLLTTSSIAWSLLGGITAPLFNAGNLKASEEIARLRLKQQEQAYLNTLYGAFAEVENAISNEKNLLQRYHATLDAEENALAAENLSFEQYQKGLVTYTTVLDAQSRAFNAQSSLIQIKNQLLNNRVNLHLALGGDFSQNNNNQQDDSTYE